MNFELPRMRSQQEVAQQQEKDAAAQAEETAKQQDIAQLWFSQISAMMESHREPGLDIVEPVDTVHEIKDPSGNILGHSVERAALDDDAVYGVCAELRNLLPVDDGFLYTAEIQSVDVGDKYGARARYMKFSRRDPSQSAEDGQA
jgi:hypothetical protein